MKKMLDDETLLAAFRLLGEESQILMLVDESGYVIWQTEAAARLLGLDWNEPIMAALGEDAARIVREAARDRGWIEVKETFDDVPYRLRSHPVSAGLLLHACLCADEPGVSKIERVRGIREAGLLGRMMKIAKEGSQSAPDENARRQWERMETLVLQARRDHLHSDIIGGAVCLDETLGKLDLALICRETAEAVNERKCLWIEAPEGSFPAVLSREIFQFVLLNLLTNAIDGGAEKISIALRRENDRIHLAVADDGGSLTIEKLGRTLGGWHGGADGGDAKMFSQFGLGLPAVQTLLGRLGGGLYADAQDGMTRFSAVFPGDLILVSQTVEQVCICSGIEDLVRLELSVLDDLIDPE